MTITATARRHVVRALREALRIREREAAFIVDWFVNVEQLEKREIADLRGVRALIIGAEAFSPRAALYLDDGRGFEPLGVDLELEPINVQRWLRLPIEEAYAIAAEIHQNRGQGMIDADRALEAERAQWAAEAAAERDVYDALLVANDDDLHEAFGLRSIEPIWNDATIIRADVAPAGDHVLVVVEDVDGERETMGMFPLFSDVNGLMDYLRGEVGEPRRLCIRRPSVFDTLVPAGFDRYSMRVVDMILTRDTVRLAA